MIPVPEDLDVVDEHDRVVDDDACQADHPDPGHDDSDRHERERRAGRLLSRTDVKDLMDGVSATDPAAPSRLTAATAPRTRRVAAMIARMARGQTR